MLQLHDGGVAVCDGDVTESNEGVTGAFGLGPQHLTGGDIGYGCCLVWGGRGCVCLTFLWGCSVNGTSRPPPSAPVSGLFSHACDAPGCLGLSWPAAEMSRPREKPKKLEPPACICVLRVSPGLLPGRAPRSPKSETTFWACFLILL